MITLDVIPESQICRKYGFAKRPSLDANNYFVIKGGSYIQRPYHDYIFSNYCLHHEKHKMPNIMICGPPGVGKTIFVENFFFRLSPKLRYHRIDMSRFIVASALNADSFFWEVFKVLNRHLETQARSRYWLGTEQSAMRPLNALQRIIKERFNDEAMKPLFLFLDNLDANPIEPYVDSLSQCFSLFRCSNIIVILACRQRFQEFVYADKIGKFYSLFDAAMDLTGLDLLDVLKGRLGEVTTTEYIFPLALKAVVFLDLYANRNLKVALQYTDIVLATGAKLDWSIPIDEMGAIKALHLNNLIPRPYELHFPEDIAPLCITLIERIRAGFLVDDTFFRQIQAKYSFEEYRTRDILQQLIDLEIFTPIPVTKKGGQHQLFLQLTQKGAQFIGLIDRGIIQGLDHLCGISACQKPYRERSC